MKLGAVLFGAGRGGRMGGPKGLLAVHDMPLAFLQAAALLEGGAVHVIVAVPEDVARVLESKKHVLAAHGNITILPVVTTEPRETILLGARALAEVALVDHLFVHPLDGGVPKKETCAALISAIDCGAPMAATPRHSGRGGHPVLLRATLLPALEGAVHLQALLQSLGESRSIVEVEDPAVIIDLDTPEDVRKAFGEEPQFLEEP